MGTTGNAISPCYARQNPIQEDTYPYAHYCSHRGGGGGGLEGVGNTFHGNNVCHNNCASGDSGLRLPSTPPAARRPLRSHPSALRMPASCRPSARTAIARTSSSTSCPRPRPPPSPPGMRKRTLSFIKFGPIKRGSNMLASCGSSANAASKSARARSRYL